MDPAWIFIAIGMLLLSGGVLMAVFGVYSQFWPRVNGYMEFIAVEREGGYSGVKGQTERIKVRYSYVVSDKTYHGKRVSFGSPELGSNHELIGKEETQVSYCPWMPNLSVLVPGFRSSTLVFVLGGLVFIWPLLAKFFT